MSDACPTLPVAHDDADSLLRLVADSVPAMMAYYALDLKCRFANRRYAEANGFTVDTILGLTVRQVIGEEAWRHIEPHVMRVQAGQAVRYVREQVMPGGETGAIEVNLIPHFSDTGEQTGAFVLINEITRQWRAERALRESETRMRKFVQASNEGIVFHRDGLITDVNEALLRMGGYDMADMTGRSVLEFVPAEWRPTIIDRIRGQSEEPYEAEMLLKRGERLPVELAGKVMPYDGENHRMVIVRDITFRKQARERMEFLALHDALTQLPNRLYLDEYMERTLALARRQHNAVALFFIDLDDFKQINDTLGHQAGDEVLRETAQRLRAAVRESDLVARLGGDEFLVVLTNIESERDTERIANSVLAAMQPPVLLKRQLVTALPSIGIAMYPEHGDSMDALIRCADTAMYQAKQAGGNRHVFWSAA
ncbi:MAG: diguanylate cyclase [Rhodocyclaceae bacterium]|nr:diguanylate cyclase [Rhodocyclaceae bacterium]